MQFGVIPDLSLDAVEFGPTSRISAGRALPSKRNGASPVLTQWVPGMDRLDVVYALVQKPATRLTVDITLRVVSEANQRIWIRSRLQTLSSNVLGTVPPTPVDITSGQRKAEITVGLDAAALRTAGVSRSLVVWIWEWSDRPDGTYAALATTSLRVYVVIREPFQPWTANAGKGEVIWTEVLDWSCRWAAAARSRRTAAAAIARRIHELGHLGFTVSKRSEAFRWNGGTSHLLGKAIACTNFLALLSGETSGAKARANCTDLAALVLLFANALGCRLRVYRISRRGEPLRLNDLRLIGHDRLSTIRVMPMGGFEYHDVAGNGRTMLPAVIYDACVALDSDEDPERPPAFWSTPAGVKRRGTDSYENRLLSSAGRVDIRWKRLDDFFIDRVPVGATSPDDAIAKGRFDRYLEILRAERQHHRLGVPSGFDEYELSPEPVLTRERPTWFSGTVPEHIWVADSQRSGHRIYISTFPSADRATAERITAEMLARCEPQAEALEDNGQVLMDKRRTLGGFVVRNLGVTVDGDHHDVSVFTLALAAYLANLRN